MADAATEVVLRDERIGTDASRVTATVLPDGTVVIAGVDMGPGVEAALGDWDYEYWIRIAGGDRDKLLLELLKEGFAKQFRTTAAFRVWLTERAIPSENQSY